MYKKLPFILLMIIIASILLNPIISLTTKQIIYACSLTTKSIVLFLLPFIIFGLLFKTFMKLAGNALSVVCLIFGCLCISNFTNTFLTHYVGSLFYYLDFDIGTINATDQPLIPYFSLELPMLIKNEFALFGGMISGVIAAFVLEENTRAKISTQLEAIIQKLFTVISALIPFFIVGFVIKCSSEGTLVSLMKSYSLIFVMFLIYASCYAFLFYLFVSEGNFKKCTEYLKNMMPLHF